MVLNILLVTKMVIKLYMPIEEVLMKLNNISLLIKNDELLDKYNEIWDKVSNTIKEGFDSEYVYHEKYLITKIKSYETKSTQTCLEINC